MKEQGCAIKDDFDYKVSSSEILKKKKSFEERTLFLLKIWREMYGKMLKNEI